MAGDERVEQEFNEGVVLYRLNQLEKAQAEIKKENTEAHRELGDKIDALREAVTIHQVKIGVGSFLISALTGFLTAVGVKKLF